jgi:hypothetical protein
MAGFNKSSDAPIFDSNGAALRGAVAVLAWLGDWP